MTAQRLDVHANIARDKAEKAAERAVEGHLQRSRDMISAVRKIVESKVGLAATEELLLNEAAEVREERREREMIRRLKAGV